MTCIYMYTVYVLYYTLSPVTQDPSINSTLEAGWEGLVDVAINSNKVLDWRDDIATIPSHMCTCVIYTVVDTCMLAVFMNTMCANTLYE